MSLVCQRTETDEGTAVCDEETAAAVDYMQTECEKVAIVCVSVSERERHRETWRERGKERKNR